MIPFTSIGATASAFCGRNYPEELLNADAEQGDVVWTFNGARTSTSEAGVTPSYGSRFFYGGDGGNDNDMAQTVFLGTDPQLWEDIDGGAADITVTWEQSSFNGDDTAGLRLRFRDVYDNFLEEDQQPRFAGPQSGAWQTYSRTITIPANTRHVNLGFLFDRVFGSATNAYIDEISYSIQQFGPVARTSYLRAYALLGGDEAGISARKHRTYALIGGRDDAVNARKLVTYVIVEP